MISAWDVYWVMQLDSIGGALTVLTGLVALAFVCCFVVGLLNAGSNPDEWSAPQNKAAAEREKQIGQKLISWLKPLGAAFAVLLVTSALLPSSKTAAAMLILPAITSDNVVEAIKPEARELYDLAKDALRGLGKPEAKEAAKDGDK